MQIRTLNLQVLQDKLLEIVNLDQICFNLDSNFAASMWSEENYLLQLPQKWKLSQIALSQEQFVTGLLVASRSNDTYGHIHRLMVSPKYRRQGVSTKLLSNFEIAASSLSIRKITLYVHTTNTNAISGYLRNGYHICLGDEFNEIARLKGRASSNGDFILDENSDKNYIMVKELIYKIKE